MLRHVLLCKQGGPIDLSAFLEAHECPFRQRTKVSPIGLKALLLQFCCDHCPRHIVPDREGGEEFDR